MMSGYCQLLYNKHLSLLLPLMKNYFLDVLVILSLLTNSRLVIAHVSDK